MLAVSTDVIVVESEDDIDTSTATLEVSDDPISVESEEVLAIAPKEPLSTEVICVLSLDVSIPYDAADSVEVI